jgi:hypothetical protein
MRASPAPHPRTQLLANLLLTALALGALAWAWRADLRYCERHLLVWYYAYDADEERVARNWRIVGVIAGLLILFVVRPLAARWAARRSLADAAADVARYGVAAVLAIGVSELALRRLHLPKPPDPALHVEMRIGRPDARYGWIWTPSRSSTLVQSGRAISYDINAESNRASAVDDAPDFHGPALLFTGESIVAGHGLAWDETLPALVGKAVNLPVINVGVHGYGADQAFLRFADTLPRMEHPVAVITFFIAPMLARCDGDSHPHLGFDGATPFVKPTSFWDGLHVRHVAKNVVPYHGDGAYDLVARVLRETERRARERGAKSLFVVPQSWDHETPRRDRWLLDELFTKQGLRFVDVDFGFVPLPDDVLHPDVASTRRLADAVVAALRAEIAQR